jgi:dihydrofolate synthase/folylpolyglutamate synthase
MNFSQAQSYLLATVNESASRREPHRLDRMRDFLAALGNPQSQYPAIQIGGTSGKGSTCTMIAAALTAAGKKTGLHTKPHLRSMTERAAIDGVAISEESFASVMDQMMPAIDRITAQHSRPSYYETLLALTLLYFAQEDVDVAVVEVGIGGKLDGTNVLVPVVCGITNVGLDHMDVLGDTVEEIAADKAGIAKAGVPLVTAAQPPADTIIREQCRIAGAPFVQVQDVVQIEADAAQSMGQRLTVSTPAARYELELPVLGDFQKMNAATAIVVLEQLPAAIRPDKSAVETGLSRVQLTGRMEYFPSHPGLLFDIAHNADKAQHLARALANDFPDRRFTIVMAVGESKDAREIVRAFADLPASFIFTSFDTPGRSATKPQRLASIAEGLGVWGRTIADPVEALSIARRNAGSEDVVVVTGSTFIVSELREWWIENVRAVS